MTNQEAITWLTQLSAGIEWELDMSYAAALDMAIEALKAQDAKHDEKARMEQGESDKLGVKTGKTCADAISRTAAIAEFSCCELTPDGGIDANYAIDFLMNMPSAQPERKWIPCIERLAVDIGYLYDWYQNSVTADPPVWTDEHIKELFHDFYLIPKQENR